MSPSEWGRKQSYIFILHIALCALNIERNKTQSGLPPFLFEDEMVFYFFSVLVFWGTVEVPYIIQPPNSETFTITSRGLVSARVLF